jgi:glycosyltransferase involved in cell wall biosynthesis
MRILVFHGYLLHGTGSNVYNARLAEALGRAGHDVELLSQDPAPPDLGPRVRHHRPDIGGLLPVYVHDRYPDLEARTFLECSDAEVEAYVARNVAAVRDVIEATRPDVALANHLVMGPVILARAGSVPYAVKIHGSALEYVVARDPARFRPYAEEGLARARTILVGSGHTAQRLAEVMGDGVRERTCLGPPGVDVDAFRPREDAAQAVRALAEELARRPSHTGPESAFSRDASAAGRALLGLDFARDRHVAFVGKLLRQKGVDLLAAAWPLVVAGAPDARLVLVGFGGWEEPLRALLDALRAGDLDAARRLADAERLHLLRAFLDDLSTAPDRDAYLAAAARLDERVVFTGRLEHAELAPLLAACAAQVVPSTFPEAFGMVAAEAAACGALPVSAAHSGLAEVTDLLRDSVPDAARDLLSFDLGPRAVRDLADRLVRWLRAPDELRGATRDALVAVARDRFSWDGVAAGVVAAGEGRHDVLVRAS